MTEAPGGAARLTRGMPLLAEFPLCEVPPHSNDSVYPSLSWQPKATRRAVMRLAAAAPWFKVGICMVPLPGYPTPCVRLANRERSTAHCLRHAWV